MGITPLNDLMFINIFVRKPTMEDNSYISYAILVETNNPSFSLCKSIIRRRYSEFNTLRETLIKQCPSVKPPSLPSKSLFKNRLKPDFLEKRRQELESFLIKLVQRTVYLSNKTFHLFLQSAYTMNDIKDIVEGRIIIDLLADMESSSESFYDLYLDNSLAIETFTGSSQEIIVEKNDKNVKKHEPNCEAPCSHLGSVNSDQYLPPTPPGRKRVSFCDNVIVAQVHTQ